MRDALGWGPLLGLLVVFACGGPKTNAAGPKPSPSSSASASPSASASAEKEHNMAALIAELEGDDDDASESGDDPDDAKKKPKKKKKKAPKKKAKKGKGGEDASDEDDDEPKKKDKKIPTAAERTERYCEASCARDVRCMDEDDVDEHTLDGCRRACRRGEGRKTDRLRNAFVFVYATCLDELECDDEASICRDRVVAKVLKADEDSREDYLACEARRKACGLETDRCQAHAWSNPGIRRALDDCLQRPCGRLQQCLRDATWR